MSDHSWKNLKDLRVLDEAIWQALEDGAARGDSPLRTAALSTVGEGRPHTRTVILRAAGRGGASLDFFTDARSSKLEELEENPHVAWCFWDPERQVQIRAEGRAELHRGDAPARAAWDALGPRSRRSYLTIHPPGTATGGFTTGLPPAFEQRHPELPETEHAFANFCLVRTRVHLLDYLFLGSLGHHRAQFHWQGSDWRGSWVVP